jgi:hydroxymethylglutaryl-CoA synthase
LDLAAILDIAQPGDRIFAVSYGSGSGSDAFSIEVKDEIEEKRDLAPKVQDRSRIKHTWIMRYIPNLKEKLRMAGLSQS